MELRLSKQAKKPIRFFVELIVLIGFFETIIMSVLDYFALSGVIATAIDVGLISALSAVVTYYRFLNPLRSVLTTDLESLKVQMQAIDETHIISITDPKGTIIYTNDLFCKISGYQHDELIGQNHRLLNSGLHSKEFWGEFWRTLRSGQCWQGEIRNRKKDGSHYWVSSIVYPIKNHNGEIEKIISFRFDISDRKRLEEQLAEQQSRALHLGKMGEFAEIAEAVAHEINNPVSIIQGKMNILEDLLKETFASNAEATKYWVSITKNNERIVKVIKNFNAFSRNAHASTPLYQHSFIDELIDRTLSMLGETIKSRDVKLELNIEAKLFIICDSAAIQQVLVNLILNSIHATKNLTERWIRVDAKQSSDGVCIRITDSGKGIAPELQDKLMRPFFTTKPPGEGTGLGLSNCRRIIADHGGELHYDSKAANTSFYFTLPKEPRTMNVPDKKVS